MRISSSGFLAAMLLAAHPAAAQSGGSALGGPVVKSITRAATLVEFDFNGRVRRPEATPEEAAVGLLKLSEDVRDRVVRIFAEQADALDRFVAENLDLLGQLDTASKAGAKGDQFRLGLILVEKTRPLREKGLLRDRVAAALPSDAGAEFGRMLDDYWNAVIAEGKQKPKEDGSTPGWLEVVIQERAAGFLREIERSFQRQSSMGTLYMDAFFKGLDLTPAQRERFRSMAMDLALRNDFKVSEEQQGKLLLGASGFLTPAQLEVVARRLRGEYVDTEASKPAPPKPDCPADGEE